MLNKVSPHNRRHNREFRNMRLEQMFNQQCKRNYPKNSRQPTWSEQLPRKRPPNRLNSNKQHNSNLSSNKKFCLCPKLHFIKTKPLYQRQFKQNNGNNDNLNKIHDTILTDKQMDILNINKWTMSKLSHIMVKKWMLKKPLVLLGALNHNNKNRHRRTLRNHWTRRSYNIRVQDRTSRVLLASKIWLKVPLKKRRVPLIWWSVTLKENSCPLTKVRNLRRKKKKSGKKHIGLCKWITLWSCLKPQNVNMCWISIIWMRMTRNTRKKYALVAQESMIILNTMIWRDGKRPWIVCETLAIHSDPIFGFNNYWTVKMTWIKIICPSFNKFIVEFIYLMLFMFFKIF